jgi:hypothetical protein
LPGFALTLPRLESLDPRAALLTALAGLMLLGLHRGMGETIALLALVGIVASQV